MTGIFVGRWETLAFVVAHKSAGNKIRRARRRNADATRVKESGRGGKGAIESETEG